MTLSAVSDLASAMARSRTSAQTRQAMDRAGQELASGQRADLVAASGGDLSRLFALDRDLSAAQTRTTTLTIAAGRAGAAGAALAQVRGLMSGFGAPLLDALGRGDTLAAMTLASEAADALHLSVSALNGRFAGQALFAGAAVDGAALIPGQQMLADVMALTAGAPDAAAVLAIVDDYFLTPGGGYLTGAWLGAAENAPRAELGDGTLLAHAPRADDPLLCGALRAMAIVAVAAQGAHGGTAADTQALLQAAAIDALGRIDPMIGLESRLGADQARIDAALTRADDTRATLMAERNVITAADPFEVATRLESLRLQLDTIHTITARLSGLRLTNYLR